MDVVVIEVIHSAFFKQTRDSLTVPREGPTTMRYTLPTDGPRKSMGSTGNPRKRTSLQTQVDHNTPHATVEAGETHGFGGGIIHGLFSWNATTDIVLWYHVHQNELGARIVS